MFHSALSLKMWKIFEISICKGEYLCNISLKYVISNKDLLFSFSGNRVEFFYYYYLKEIKKTSEKRKQKLMNLN